MKELKSTTSAGAAARQEQLEAVFATVDQIKIDLNQATAITMHGTALGTYSEGRLPVVWKIKNGNLMRYLDGDDGLAYIAADEFQVTHFPEANSVLYRIGMKGELIRGYIFLLNVVK